MDTKEDLLKAFNGFLDKHFGGTQKEASEDHQEVTVAKSLDEDKRLFTAVVLRPEVEDAHGDIYSHDVVEKACHDYVEFCMNQNLQHMIDVEKQDVAVVESYISQADMTLGEGEVFKGDWIMTVKVHNDTVWDMCKAGDFTGFSVGCSAITETLEEDDA